MKVQEFRDLIDALIHQRNSLCSAVGSHEQRVEADRLRRLIGEMTNAFGCCWRATDYDRDRASKWIEISRNELEVAELQFELADAAWVKMVADGPKFI